MSDDSDITYDVITTGDGFVLFSSHDDEGLNWTIEFLIDSPITINKDGKIMATTTEGEPVILTFFKSVPIDFLS